MRKICFHHAHLRANFIQTYESFFLRSLREKANLLSKAAEGNISSEEANKLRSQAAEITFNDITECINVSMLVILLRFCSCNVTE